MLDFLKAAVAVTLPFTILLTAMLFVYVAERLLSRFKRFTVLNLFIATTTLAMILGGCMWLIRS